MPVSQLFTFEVVEEVHEGCQVPLLVAAAQSRSERSDSISRSPARSGESTTMRETKVQPRADLVRPQQDVSYLLQYFFVMIRSTKISS